MRIPKECCNLMLRKKNLKPSCHCAVVNSRCSPMSLWLSWMAFLLSVSSGLSQHSQETVQALSWAVCLQIPNEAPNVERLARVADELALAAGLVNKGQIGELKDHYLFTSAGNHEDLNSGFTARETVEGFLAEHSHVRWYTLQRHLRRSKRSVTFNDPKYPHQWHLNNIRRPGMDINVTGVWERNVTGRGVTVVVVDDGVEHTLADIYPNYVSMLKHLAR